MQSIIDFFQNAWFIGIVGGIISGVIVYYLTSFVLDRKSNGEHKRNIRISNEEVLLILRPYIANSGLPSIKQMTAIINSISRRYNVTSEEMKTVSMFYEDLIVDFVSNVYIPEDIKKQRIAELLSNISEFDSMKLKQASTEKQPQKMNKYSRKLSLLTGVLSTLSSITISILFTMFGNANFNSMSIIVSIIIVFANLLILVFSLIINKNKRSISEKYKLMKYEDMRMQNHGTDLNLLYDDKFLFVDYFNDGD